VCGFFLDINFGYAVERNTQISLKCCIKLQTKIQIAL